MADIFAQARERLTADAGTDAAKLRIADFIAWLLESGNHGDKAEEVVKAGEKESVLTAVYGSIESKARKAAVGECACIEDKDVYMWAVEFLQLTDCVTREEIAGYCSGGLHANAKPAVPPVPEKTSPFSVDIDSLFD